MKALIIDDEPKARNILKVLIKENCPKIDEIYVAEDLLTGVDIIKNKEVNVVFLDIEMPRHSGLEILDFIDRNIVDFEIIFTTAYDEYAIKAFQLSAIDYLLKPLSSTQVKQAVDKCIAQIGKTHTNQKIEELRENLTAAGYKKIALPIASGVRFVEIDKIVVLEADRMYTKITLDSAEELLISKPLKYFVDILETNSLFYKTHRSFMINLKYVKEFSKSNGGFITMDNKQVVSISKECRDHFLEVISSL